MKNMFRRFQVFALICIFIASLIGCSVNSPSSQDEIAALQAENTELSNRLALLLKQQDYLQDNNKDLEEELIAARLELEQLHGQADMGSFMLPWLGFESGYAIVEPEHRLWLSTEECALYLVYAASNSYSSLAPGSVLEAYAAIQVDEGIYGSAEIWLLVHTQFSDAGEIPLYWVKQSECVPYTADNQEDACWPVYIRDGEALQNYPSGKEMAEISRFYINEIENGIANISERGWTGSTSVENIIFPDPVSFSYIETR